MVKVPSAPIISDEYVAQLLLKEASHHSKPMLLNNKETGGEINKLYLSNLIKNVDSHNKREEVADCWRQHDMKKWVMQQSCATNSRSRIRVNDRASTDEYSDERSYWALKKLEKQALENDANNLVVSNIPEDYVNQSERLIESVKRSRSAIERGCTDSDDEDSRRKKKKSSKTKKKKKEKHKSKKKSSSHDS